MRRIGKSECAFTEKRNAGDLVSRRGRRGNDFALPAADDPCRERCRNSVLVRASDAGRHREAAAMSRDRSTAYGRLAVALPGRSPRCSSARWRSAMRCCASRAWRCSSSCSSGASPSAFLISGAGGGCGCSGTRWRAARPMRRHMGALERRAAKPRAGPAAGADHRRAAGRLGAWPRPRRSAFRASSSTSSTCRRCRWRPRLKPRRSGARLMRCSPMQRFFWSPATRRQRAPRHHFWLRDDVLGRMVPGLDRGASAQRSLQGETDMRRPVSIAKAALALALFADDTVRTVVTTRSRRRPAATEIDRNIGDPLRRL